MGTSPVSSTSTLVENGGVVGKWIMQLSIQVSVLELANTNTHYNGQIPYQYHDTMHASSIFRLPLSIQSTVCSQGQEPRVSDGRQDSKRVPPSMQCELLRKTTQYLKSRNRQSHGWQTHRLIPRHGRILFRWVFLRLKIRIEDKFLPCLFLSGPFLCLCSGDNPCLRLCLGGKGENHTSDSHPKPFLPLFPEGTKQSPLLAKFRDLVLVLRPGMLFRVFRIYLCAFLFSFQLAALFWSGLPDTLSVVPCPVNTIPPDTEIHEQMTMINGYVMTNGYGKLCTTTSTLPTSVRPLWTIT